MKKTNTHKEINDLLKNLRDRGVTIKQSDVTEALAKTKGFRNSHEMMKAAKEQEDHPIDVITGSKSHKSNHKDDKSTKLKMMKIERDELLSQLEQFEELSKYDWATWRKSLKGLPKTSHHNQDPIDDDALKAFRLAVANNTVKSKRGERESAEYAVMQMAKKYAPAILARLTRAEELLGKGQVIDGPVLENISNIYEVTAVRDGEEISKIFYCDEKEKAQNKAVIIAAKMLNIEDQYSDEDGYDENERIEMLQSEFDMFSCETSTLKIDAIKMAKALQKGEASVEINLALKKLAMEAGIDPRKKSDIIYPLMES